MNGTQTLGRALDILFALAEAETTLSVSEIAEKVMIPESTAYRLLQTLEQNGIVERRTKGQIGLGLRILDLARSLHQQIDRELFVLAKPIMERLTEELNETSILMVRSGMNAVCIQSIESRRLIRLAIENGRILPLHQGASGKAILAFEKKKVIDHVLETIPEEKKKKKLVEELEQIRKQGYSKTIGEVDPDVYGIAVPVFDHYNSVIASLTIAGPANRLQQDSDKQMVEAIRQAVNEITKKLFQFSQIT